MARFRGTVRGGRGPGASRLGHAKGGLVTVAQAGGGQVRTYLYVLDDVDMARVTLEAHGGGSGRVLYDGPVDAWALVEQ